MLANYGYNDGSGDFFITIDTEKCNGCGECIPACPAGVFVLSENEYDMDAENEIAVVSGDISRKIKYACGPCKPWSGYEMSALPCIKACVPSAIQHSW